MKNNNPLLKYSLAGEGNELSERAIKQEPLLGDLCLKGEVSSWYGSPNTGKTLFALAFITDAVQSKRIHAHDVFYVNADDSQAGYAEKVKILDDFGIHSLVPGEKGFKLKDLLPALNDMAESQTAAGTLVVVDTVKKITDLMDKKTMRNFGIAMRPYIMAGGSLLLLSHTNKARTASGDLVYSGTTDLLEDVDSAYILDEAKDHSVEGKKLVRFLNLKRRGSNIERVLYQYDSEGELSYPERLLSVEIANPDYADSMFANVTSEGEIELNLALAIRHSKNPAKMAIVKKVADLTKTSRRKVQDVLDQHTDDDPAVGFWAYEVRARGAHVYRLHPQGLALTENVGAKAA